MPTLTITPTYSPTTLLSKAKIDSIPNAVETFVNSTKLDATNINIDQLISSFSSAESSSFLTLNGLGASTFQTLSVDTTPTSSTMQATTPSSGTYLILCFGRLNFTYSGVAVNELQNNTSFKFRNATAAADISLAVNFEQRLKAGTIFTSYANTENVHLAAIGALSTNDIVRLVGVNTNVNASTVLTAGTTLMLLKLTD